MSSLSLRGIHKTYRTGSLEVPVLHGIDLEIGSGELVAVMGPSGSGKSTLMNIIGLLDRPTSGSLHLGGHPITLSMSDRTLARIRAEKIGFVFQSFNLLPKLSALSNVLLPTAYHRTRRSNPRAHAESLLRDLGLGSRIRHTPTELSGGEKQRVAIARALVNNPEIILADEPTGNLDSASGSDVMNVLVSLADKGKTVMIVTHDPSVASRCHRIIRIKDGMIENSGKEDHA